MTAPISKSINKSGLSGASAEIEISNMEFDEYFGWQSKSKRELHILRY